MGLDMYLEAETQIYNMSDKEKEKNAKIRKVLEKYTKGIDSIRTGNLDYIRIVFEVGYWRKANGIHKWFVDNVQNGVDDCGRYEVSRDKLKELREICLEIQKDISKAPELLPTQSGFFFGNTEYDKWYMEDINNTIKIIDDVLKLPEGLDGWWIYYHSSW